MMIDEQILTLEEVSKYLRVPVDAVRKEVNAGRLRAMDIAGHYRVREYDLAKFKNEAYTSAVPLVTPATASTGVLIDMHPAQDFGHTWPDGKAEEYVRVLEGVASSGAKDYQVKVGFTHRESAGRRRSRTLVLVNRYPTVEFVAATDEVQPTGKMVSIIRGRNGKQLPVGAGVPPEYEGFPIGPYRSVVDGPGAPNGLAVICDARDSEVMVEHALIRYRFREERE
jgi:excisionase family DNA binding protein